LGLVVKISKEIRDAAKPDPCAKAAILFSTVELHLEP